MITPKVSIIIPCYNVEKYIDKCLNSVKEQSYDDYEVILIDDGSTDNTLEKCVEWKNKDERIILISKKNEGLGETRNLGISTANSNYITFLDADDWLSENYLSEMTKGTEGEKNDLVICDFNIVYKNINTNSNNISVVRLPEGKIDKLSEKYILSKARTQACGKLYKKSLFIENNIKEPAHNYEDVATTPYIVAKAKNIYHVAKPLYFYLKNREGSIINYFPYLTDLLLSLTELIQNFQNDNIFEKYRFELRRIFWGELCFLYRMLDTKFSVENEKIKKELCQKCDNIVYKNFPELQFIPKQKFYTDDNLIKDALKCILTQKNQIVNDMSKADCIINFKDKILQKKLSDKIILLDNINNALNDKEKIVWDLADEIFDNLINFQNILKKQQR